MEPHQNVITIEKNVSLKTYSTFNIGGRSKFFITISNREELIEALRWLHERNIPCYILGGGSNVLISDRGFSGATLKLASDDLKIDGELIYVGAGFLLGKLVNVASKHGLSGIENLAGIPGTVGGAVRGNAGAFGVEIQDTLVSISALHKEELSERQFNKAQCDFKYRNSYFKSHPEWIITQVTFKLTRGDRDSIERRVHDIIEQREHKHIQNIKSAGSCFINPTADSETRAQFEHETGAQSHDGRVPAGWLISKAGLRGKIIGDAEASSMHPNYIINRGNASFSDVTALISLIQKRVYARFKIKLQTEVHIIGTP